MRTIKQLTCTALILAATVAAALATPIKRTDVPAQPLWLLHIDCDALRPTQVGQYLLAEMEKPEAQAKFAAFQVMSNFDLRRHLRGLTLYSTGHRPEEGVLMAYADFDPERLVNLVKTAKQYESTVHNQHTIHSWIDAKKAGGRRVYAAIHGGRVIFGQRSEAVAAALDVIDGGNTLQTSGAFPQFTGAATASFIQGASRKLELPESDPSAAILKQSKSIRFDLSEVQQKVSASIVLEAGSEEVARHIASIAKGLVALMKLQTRNPDAAKLADTALLDQQGGSVNCHWEMPAVDAIELMKAAAFRKAAAQSAAK